MAKPPTKKAAPKKAAAKKTATKKPAKNTADVKSSAKAAAFLEQGAKTKVDADHNAKLDLLDKVMGYGQELSDIQLSITERVGKKGSKVKNILQVEDWNRKGFQDIMGIMKMSGTARADFLRTFKPLFDVLYAEVWETELQDLLTQLEAEANPEADLDTGEEAASFEAVDVLAETGNAKPASKTVGKAENKASGDPEIQAEAEAFEASADELEEQLAAE